MFSYCSFVIALSPLCFKSQQDCINPQNIYNTFQCCSLVCHGCFILLIALHIMRQKQPSAVDIHLSWCHQRYFRLCKFHLFVLNHVCFMSTDIMSNASLNMFSTVCSLCQQGHFWLIPILYCSSTLYRPTKKYVIY